MTFDHVKLDFIFPKTPVRITDGTLLDEDARRHIEDFYPRVLETNERRDAIGESGNIATFVARITDDHTRLIVRRNNTECAMFGTENGALYFLARWTLCSNEKLSPGFPRLSEKNKIEIFPLLLPTANYQEAQNKGI